MKQKEKNKYCLFCGNSLDPKIHIKDFGKSSKEVAEFQKKILRLLLTEVYFKFPDKTRIQLGSIVEKLAKMNKNVAGIVMW